MALQITGKNMDIGAALRQRAEERVSAAVAKYFDGNFSGQVVIGHDGGGYRADCTVHLDTGTVLKTSATSGDPTASFEAAAERIEKRLRRYKRRLKDHHPHHAGNGGAPEVEAPSYVVAGPDEDEEVPVDYAPVIVAENMTRIRTMTVGMAVLELDLTEAPVLVFRSAASGAINVVYRRSDGNFGWIDPSGAPGQA